MHLLWVFLVSRSMGFSTKEEILDVPESDFNSKKEIDSDLTQMVKPNRKWSCPPTQSMWQDQAKEEAFLNTHFFIILIHSLLYFLTMEAAQNCDQGNINLFSWSQSHRTPFFTKVCLPLQFHLWVPLSLSYLFFSKFKGSFKGKSRCWAL